mmetsp:Transcript_11703/g.17729  ORF Transcript_11703/g.17729 Transcript_11703/m.17729 type:complete len:307 (+) Transcript_11703:102-1022(+)|eukprot:CAMPEP_0185024878 /NCGR_PEP_ID=MMETSP1103-20130426/8056_1 /TAXON_ID=36769 /ORGANISM="Paraphysomonas bandaiensis, Strain Caron Lab Isolate" /LENGTH=306 /DNA_ID=CAMNT_0027557955 /DNA_START=44 /DNA_END=964 /DNA_ORIENTATION=+
MSISQLKPIAPVIRYAHLGIAVTDFTQSIDFFSRLGFELLSCGSSHMRVMKNKGGLDLHLFQCDQNISDGKNLLMDMQGIKYPGHTHAAFSVPTVPGVKAYFENNGVGISGTRGVSAERTLAAVFVRDPDRTTFEFENNFGPDEDVEVTGDMLGYPQSIDHVGIRVSNPEERWVWYAEKLGFNISISKYVANEDPLKNTHPWICRTDTGAIINFLVNANTSADGNILCNEADGVRPGIVYIAYEVEDVGTAAERLTAAGVEVVWDKELETAGWGLRDRHILYPTDKQSIFIRDGDLNLVRLVSASS